MASPFAKFQTLTVQSSEAENSFVPSLLSEISLTRLLCPFKTAEGYPLDFQSQTAIVLSPDAETILDDEANLNRYLSLVKLPSFYAVPYTFIQRNDIRFPTGNHVSPTRGVVDKWMTTPTKRL